MDENLEPVTLVDRDEYVEVQIEMSVLGKRYSVNRVATIRGPIQVIKNSTVGLQAMMSSVLEAYITDTTE